MDRLDKKNSQQIRSGAAKSTSFFITLKRGFLDNTFYFAAENKGKFTPQGKHSFNILITN